MQLFTQIPIAIQQENQIDYASKLLLLGSCFSENIGKKLTYFKLDTTLNPFGILFHPKAIETFLSCCAVQKKFTSNDVFFHNERWHCFDAHSSLSAITKEKLLNNLNQGIIHTHQVLTKATHVVITLGTAWVYRFIEHQKIVASCHKVPQKSFLKEILSVDAIVKSLQQLNSYIHSINKNCNIIYTVSPVRHIKDGFVQNMQSKSHLITAIHKILTTRNVFYFPSYEIMMDELRDYRFYTQDMIHPNQTAINYIWEQFEQAWLSLDEKNIRKEIDTIQKGLAHRPFNTKSKEHQQFLIQLEQKIKSITSRYPNIKFT